ncbi:MAG: TIGR04283 family arsenosugar biosynthesis glycosyltransferase [Pseudorhodoplanes sp.]
MSIIVPVLNEARTIAQSLFALKPFRQRGVEIVVVDGGSRDETPLLARPLADQVIRVTGTRGHRMNEGAKVANGFIFVFLRSDTKLPDDADTQVMYGRARDTSVWGRFDLRYAGRHAMLPLFARMMNWYSANRGVATGDQAIFVQREAFFRTGGFSDIPFMEDVEISKRLRQISPPIVVASRVTAPGKHFDEDGFWRTVRDMIQVRLRYRFGADPVELANRYSRDPVGIPPPPEPPPPEAIAPPAPRMPLGPRRSLPPDNAYRGPGSGGQRRR